MAAIQRKLVHKQFNSPIGMYSQENVKDTLNRELKAFGSKGIEIDDQIARPLNLACSEVLRAVEEEDQMKCEPFVKFERQSRSRQRICQRPHTPVHQHQLEQIKTKYLNHQHDVTIDRDTVLKINRLATRRNLHKREHSWPPTKMDNKNSVSNSIHEQPNNNTEKNCKIRSQQLHIRSTSIDNALQFDETVCKRHGIDIIREKFKSPTRIIEPTAQEVRQKRVQQRRLQQQKLKQQPQSQIKDANDADETNEAVRAPTEHKCKQQINSQKHKELLRKKALNKTDSIVDTTIIQNTIEKIDLQNNICIPAQQSAAVSSPMQYNQLLKIEPNDNDNTQPQVKVANQDIGLVEPKRQFYEKLASCKKWHSYDSLNAIGNAKPIAKPLYLPKQKRQSYSLERGREVTKHKQLPPQKPRNVPKLQRRSMKLATEIKISYDTDAQSHEVPVKSLNPPQLTKADSALISNQDDLEHIPLPAPPVNFRTLPINLEHNVKFLQDQPFYDDSCIFLRSIDLQDNTVAYIPAAITIVPSPTDDLVQHWIESNKLRADIKGANNIETTEAITATVSTDLQNKNENLLSQTKHESVKSVAMPDGIKHQQSDKHQQQQQQTDKKNSVDVRAETDTYVTHLPSTPNGIQLARQTSVNTTKRKTQINYNNEEKSKLSTSAFTTKTATHESPQQQNRLPQVIHSNEISAEYNKVKKDDDKTQHHQGFYYTDGEYVYGPYDPQNGTPLANTTIRSLQAERQAKHQQHEIKKDIEAETKSQHKNEIANLTAKYENIQKSINEHLRQIDAYIENAKAALKSTISKPEQSHYSHPRCNLKDQLQMQLQQQQQEKTETETPLKVILRKITNIMQEVKPLYQNQTAKQQEVPNMQQTNAATKQNEKENENMPIVDKVLMDLNMLTKHLSEFDKNTSEELKPIMEQLDLQFEIKPTAKTASHAIIKEKIAADKEILTETGKNHEKPQTNKPTTSATPSIPPPPPPPLPPSQPLNLPSSTFVPILQTKSIQEKHQTHQHQHTGDKQLLATDKLITAQAQSQQPTQYHQQTTMPVVEHKDTIAATKDENKNFVFDFITARHEQEQLVEQVIDTLGKLENESKKNLVNIHVPAHDEKIKSNLNQQTLSTKTTTSTNNKEEDVAIMQNCNISVSPMASGKDARNHGDDEVKKSTNNNESQLKLHIKDFADKKADKQFQKYDKLPAKNINDDVVNINKNDCNTHVHGQKQKHDNHVSLEYEGDNNEKNIKSKEEEGSSSELGSTYKSSYELPSPYVTMPQISWVDVLSAQTTQHQQNKEVTATTSVLPASTKPKHETDIAQVFTSTPTKVDKFATTSLTLSTMEPVVTSGHVGMQSTTPSKPRIQTRQHQQLQHGQTPDEVMRKYPASLIEPHLPTRSTSPFGLNAVDVPFIQRSTSVSPTRLCTIKTVELAATTADTRQELMQSIRKYPAPLAEPHLPTRATSPFGLNAIETQNFKCQHSAALAEESHITNPVYELEVKSNNKLKQECYDKRADKSTSPIRKYPPSLIEPHAPTRAASPFGLNAVDTTSKAQQLTPSPTRTHTHSPHAHSFSHPQQETLLKSFSTIGDNCKNAVVYVPQVEGHNIGLLVRTTTPTPYCHTDVAHASSIYSAEMINATKTPHDYITVTSNSAANDIERDDDVNAADVTCDELQRINSIGLIKRGTTRGLTVMETETYHQYQQQQQEYNEHHVQNLRQQHTGSGSGSGNGQNMNIPVDIISQPTSVINRTFDNVSPRPYISIEGYKRVAWPPTSEERIVREFTPQPQTQYQPAPAFNQQHQPSAGTAVPPTQDPNYINIQHNNNNNFVCDQNQNEYEPFPPQTPETPIILKDKQFSRLPSQESNQTNTAAYQQPQNPYMQQQEYCNQKQPAYKQPLNNYQQQQHEYQPKQQFVSQAQQQQHQSQKEEEHNHQGLTSWRPIIPPQSKQDRLFTGHLDVQKTVPSVAPPTIQQQYQNYHQPSINQQQQYRAPSFDNNQQPQQQQYQPPFQQQYSPQSQYQGQAPQAFQNAYQQPLSAGLYYQQPVQQPAWTQQQPVQQNYQQPSWIQQHQQPQQYQAQNTLNQFNQAPHHQQPQQNQFIPQTNQQQFNSYSQPQQHTVSHDQVDQQSQHYNLPHLSQDQRSASPGIITLRKEAPITQKPAPIYTSQPAAISFRGGSNMRGDLKWPPPEYKEAAAKENDERRKLALGPVCRPRKVNRDYTSFFAKNALSHHYPSYKVPPGTQHMIN